MTNPDDVVSDTITTIKPIMTGIRCLVVSSVVAFGAALSAVVISCIVLNDIRVISGYALTSCNATGVFHVVTHGLCSSATVNAVDGFGTPIVLFYPPVLHLDLVCAMKSDVEQWVSGVGVNTPCMVGPDQRGVTNTLHGSMQEVAFILITFAGLMVMVYMLKEWIQWVLFVYRIRRENTYAELYDD